MAQAEKPAAEKPAEATAAAPRKSKKMLIIIIAAVVLLIGGGAAALLLLKPASTKHAESAIENQPKEAVKFVDLGTFTSNLIREDDERYLHVSISLKVTKPELEEKIKASNPEILHRVNMVLESKRPSELASFEGKEMLAKQIKAQVEYVLGLRKIAPVISSEPTPDETVVIKNGIADVLFTSFLIQ